MDFEEVTRGEYVEHLRTLDADELVEARFALYDLAEAAEWDTPLHRSVRDCLALIAKAETRCELVRRWRDAHRISGLPGDSDAFAEALPVLVRARSELGEPLDGDIFAAALEVAERRGSANPHEREQK
jgi:hypothetical protein